MSLKRDAWVDHPPQGDRHERSKTGHGSPMRDYAAHQSSTPVFSDAQRTAEKAAQRSETKRRIAERSLSPREAQERNAPLPTPAKVVDLWGALRRRAAQR